MINYLKPPTEAYPLAWPAGRPRQHCRERARFQTPLGTAIVNLQREVQMLGGKDLVISSNLPLRRDGMPSARSTYVSEKGVAAYFMLKKKPMCFACDRWDAIEDNIQAVAKTIEALRGIERWGSGQMVEQAFTGFIALPSPEQPWQVLGLADSRPTPDQVEDAYRRLAMKHHPDRGGSQAEMARINAARDALLP